MSGRTTGGPVEGVTRIGKESSFCRRASCGGSNVSSQGRLGENRDSKCGDRVLAGAWTWRIKPIVAVSNKESNTATAALGRPGGMDSDDQTEDMG